MSEKLIEIRKLSYIYPDGTKALEEINLDVLAGDALGIIGPNGAGKSTLLLQLNGILRGGGQIKVFGLEVQENNLHQIRNKVGLVFQEPDNQLFMPSVFDDVAFGPLNLQWDKNKVMQAVDEALKEVDMLAAKMRSAHHLSYGEKKRIAIATVLSMHPEVLALDEPSSNLDPKHRRELMKLLKQLKITKIIATHDLELVLEICSRVTLLDKGKIVASGETREILKNKILLEGHGLEVPLSLSQN